MTACGPRAPDTGRIRDALPSSKDDFAEDREAACGWSSAMPRVGNITRFSGGAEMVTPVLCDVRGVACEAGGGSANPVSHLTGHRFRIPE